MRRPRSTPCGPASPDPDARSLNVPPSWPRPTRMAVLGIEGTAHTIGVGIVAERAPGRVQVLANERAMLRPASGGIVPREAAHHHAEAGPRLLESALAKAKLAPEELDGVAFSQGPGLAPCLPVAATMARALAQIGRAHV